MRGMLPVDVLPPGKKNGMSHFEMFCFSIWKHWDLPLSPMAHPERASSKVFRQNSFLYQTTPAAVARWPRSSSVSSALSSALLQTQRGLFATKIQMRLPLPTPGA